MCTVDLYDDYDSKYSPVGFSKNKQIEVRIKDNCGGGEDLEKLKKKLVLKLKLGHRAKKGHHKKTL